MSKEKCLHFEPDCLSYETCTSVFTIQTPVTIIKVMNEAARALTNMRWRYSASASTFRCRVGSATTVMIASIKRCRNQDVVAYLSYKQDTRPLFAVKCEHKELKLARVALSAEKTDSAAENALTVANL